MGLNGKTYVIVGGSSGIGRATAEMAIARGTAVEIVARDTAKLEAAAAARIGDERLTTASLNMTDEEAVHAFFAGKAE